MVTEVEGAISPLMDLETRKLGLTNLFMYYLVAVTYREPIRMTGFHTVVNSSQSASLRGRTITCSLRKSTIMERNSYF